MPASSVSSSSVDRAVVLPAELVPATIVLAPEVPVHLVDNPIIADVVAEADAPRRSWFRRAIGGCYRTIGFLFGVGSCILGLAIVASIPILQFAALGYLLEVGGRIARQRRVAAGFIGLEKATQFGTIVAGLVLIVAPLAVISRLATSARLIEPWSPSDVFLTRLLWVGVTLGVLHFTCACWRGGRLRHFLWPAPTKMAKFVWGLVTLGPVYAETRDLVWNYLASLRLPYYFWLGLRGALGALLWLVLPVTLIVLGRQVPALGFIGGLLCAIVLLYLPFLQGRFAAENRFRAFREMRAVRQLFVRAPVAFFVAQFLTLLLGVPLYLFKVEMLAPDAVWLACLVFVAFSWPARFAVGWALARSERRERPRSAVWRWSMRVAMLVVAVAYVGFIYLTQFTSWHGAASLYAQHPFLLPVPFLGN
jgi:hypothetical protein